MRFEVLFFVVGLAVVDDFEEPVFVAAAFALVLECAAFEVDAALDDLRRRTGPL